MSREEFATVLATLAVATNKELDKETVEVYFAALCDIPAETLKAGVRRVVNGAKFFPSVGELRASCDRVKASAMPSTFSVPQLPAAPLVEDDPRAWFACPTCQDSGWASHWCVGSVNKHPKHPAMWQGIGTCGSGACARFGANGYGHEYMVRCFCYASNPKIRERNEARRKYAGGDE